MVDQGLISRLPPTLTAEEIALVNHRGLSPDIHSVRPYHWGGLRFNAPPGVFLPGPTSRLVHEMIRDGRIRVRGLRYAAMGCGLGVETVLAGLRGALIVYGIDVHPPSVESSRRHYLKYVGTTGATFVGVISDLWNDFPSVAPLDVVTINPPFIGVHLSDDQDLIRNMCVGPELAQRFLRQLVERPLMSPEGVVYVTLSNTAPLRDFVSMALNHGLSVSVVHEQGWPGENVRTFILALRRRNAG